MFELEIELLLVLSWIKTINLTENTFLDEYFVPVTYIKIHAYVKLCKPSLCNILI